MSSLLSVEYAEFSFLKSVTGTSDSNLSVHLNKLEEAGYIEIKKAFRGKKPVTQCSITKEGIKAFNEYVDSLRGYINE